MTDDLRTRVARTVWKTSRRDEGTISAAGADIVADAVLKELGSELDETARLRARLADVWDEGHGTSNGGCVYWPDCAEIGHHVNPYRAALTSVPESSDREAGER